MINVIFMLPFAVMQNWYRSQWELVRMCGEVFVAQWRVCVYVCETIYESKGDFNSVCMNTL